MPNKIECFEYLTEFLEKSLEKFTWIGKIDQYLIDKREKEESKLKRQVTKRGSKKKTSNKKDSTIENNGALKKVGGLLDTTHGSVDRSDEIS